MVLKLSEVLKKQKKPPEKGKVALNYSNLSQLDIDKLPIQLKNHMSQAQKLFLSHN